MRPRLSRALTVLLALLALGTAVPAGAHARTVSAPLAGVTTVTFHGAQGITLVAPRDVSTPVSRMELTVVSGTYATVHVIPRSIEHSCLSAAPGQAHCMNMFMIAAHPPGHPEMDDANGKHAWILWGTPELMYAGATDFYLFTDGTARLVIRSPELPGNRRYAAGGRIDGGLGLMPTHCDSAPVPCTTQSGYADGTVRGGGRSFDFHRPTYVQSLSTAFVLKSSAPPVDNGSVLGGVRPCLYGDNGKQPTSPADYPFGCWLGLPANPDFHPEYDISNFANSSQGQWANKLSFAVATEATGPVYAGFSNWAANPLGQTWSVGIATWHTYGIR
jgi:hypothetical protein